MRESSKPIGEVLDITDRNDETLFTVLHHVANRTAVGRHDRQPGGHRLDQRDRHTFVDRRKTRDIQAWQQIRYVATDPQKCRARVDTQFPRQISQFGSHDHRRRSPRDGPVALTRHTPRLPEQHLMCFLRTQPGDNPHDEIDVRDSQRSFARAACPPLSGEAGNVMPFGMTTSRVVPRNR